MCVYLNLKKKKKPWHRADFCSVCGSLSGREMNADGIDLERCLGGSGIQLGLEGYVDFIRQFWRKKGIPVLM